MKNIFLSVAFKYFFAMLFLTTSPPLFSMESQVEKEDQKSEDNTKNDAFSLLKDKDIKYLYALLKNPNDRDLTNEQNYKDAIKDKLQLFLEKYDGYSQNIDIFYFLISHNILERIIDFKSKKDEERNKKIVSFLFKSLQMPYNRNDDSGDDSGDDIRHDSYHYSNDKITFPYLYKNVPFDFLKEEMNKLFYKDNKVIFSDFNFYSFKEWCEFFLKYENPKEHEELNIFFTILYFSFLDKKFDNYRERKIYRYCSNIEQGFFDPLIEKSSNKNLKKLMNDKNVYYYIKTQEHLFQQCMLRVSEKKFMEYVAADKNLQAMMFLEESYSKIKERFLGILNNYSGAKTSDKMRESIEKNIFKKEFFDKIFLYSKDVVNKFLVEYSKDQFEKVVSNDSLFEILKKNNENFLQDKIIEILEKDIDFILKIKNIRGYMKGSEYFFNEKFKKIFLKIEEKEMQELMDGEAIRYIRASDKIELEKKEREQEEEQLRREKERRANEEAFGNQGGDHHVGHTYNSQSDKLYDGEIEKYKDEVTKIKDPVKEIEKGLDALVKKEMISKKSITDGRIELYNYILSKRFKGRSGDIKGGKFVQDSKKIINDPYISKNIAYLKLALCILKDHDRFDESGLSPDKKNEKYLERVSYYLDNVFYGGASSYSTSIGLVNGYTDLDLVKKLIILEKAPGYSQMCEPGFLNLLMKGALDVIKMKEMTKNDQSLATEEERYTQAHEMIQNLSSKISNSQEFQKFDEPWSEKVKKLEIGKFYEQIWKDISPDKENDLKRIIKENIYFLEEQYNDMFKEVGSFPKNFNEFNIFNSYDDALEKYNNDSEMATLSIKNDVMNSLEKEMQYIKEVKDDNELLQFNVNNKRRSFVYEKIVNILSKIGNGQSEEEYIKSIIDAQFNIVKSSDKFNDFDIEWEKKKKELEFSFFDDQSDTIATIKEKSFKDKVKFYLNKSIHALEKIYTEPYIYVHKMPNEYEEARIKQEYKRCFLNPQRHTSIDDAKEEVRKKVMNAFNSEMNNENFMEQMKSNKVLLNLSQQIQDSLKEKRRLFVEQTFSKVIKNFDDEIKKTISKSKTRYNDILEKIKTYKKIEGDETIKQEYFNNVKLNIMHPLMNEEIVAGDSENDRLALAFMLDEIFKK